VTAPAKLDRPGDAGDAAPDTEELLRASAFLLGRGGFLPAVWILHREIEKRLAAVQAPPVPEPYLSYRVAEQHHRRLMEARGVRRITARGWLWPRDLRERLPRWAAWAIVGVVAGGLCLRYALAVLDRNLWQRQHPEGNWISRYYSNVKFEGYPLVRYDTGVDYDWGKNAPAKAMVRDRWSVRWDTCLIVTEPTPLNLRLTSDDSSKLVVDDNIAIDVGPKPGSKGGNIIFQPGTHRIRVDFREDQGEAVIHLEGLDFEGTSAYRFQRPVLQGDVVSCK